MLSFFPRPYPDELLYSVFARYHIWSGNISSKETMKELFNSSANTACIDLPAHLDSLISNLPLGTSYIADDLIMRHTLFPYYTAFLKKDRADRIKQLMRSDSKGEIHTLAGIMASTINAPKKLYLCIECCKEDKEKYGEAYWHRIHQAPGVLYCPQHNQPLYLYTSNINELNKHVFVAADVYKSYEQPHTVKHSSEEISKFVEIAKNISWIIENYSIIRNSDGIEEGFRERYITVLKEKGFATSSGRVYQHELISSFKNYYGEEFLNAVQSNIECDEQFNWLSSIVRRHRKSFHPLRHVLLIKYLSGSLSDFFEFNRSYSPFGKEPWLCLNAAAEHYKKAVVRKLKITHCADTKLPVGTFECSCGFIYSRRGPDTSEDDSFKIGRIKSFGAVWENKLREYVEQEKLSMRETARRLKVDPNTVKKYADILGLNTSWESKIEVKECTTTECCKSDCEINSLNNKHIKYRNLWLEIIENNPNLTKTELRNISNGVYTWLYRNDRPWLNSNSPKKETQYKQVSRVDWEKRDKELVKLVRKSVNELLNADTKPIRVTIGKIGKMNNSLAVLEKHLDKLPKTRAYLLGKTESLEEFQNRKVIWAAKELIKSEEELKAWKVIRKAGLRPDSKIDVNNIIQSVSKYCKESLYSY